MRPSKSRNSKRYFPGLNLFWLAGFGQGSTDRKKQAGRSNWHLFVLSYPQGPFRIPKSMVFLRECVFQTTCPFGGGAAPAAPQVAPVHRRSSAPPRVRWFGPPPWPHIPAWRGRGFRDPPATKKNKQRANISPVNIAPPKGNSV